MAQPVSISAAERLVSLTAALVNRRMRRDEILERVSGYGGDCTDESAARQFERDKQILREAGVPLQMHVQAARTGDVFYWIDESSWSMPEIRPSPIQLALMRLALRAVTPSSRRLPFQALTKLSTRLEPNGAEADVELTTSIDTADPEASFDDLAYAIDERQPVSFRYWSARGERSERHLNPWRLLRHDGAWYVTGWDREREQRRTFRLSRIEGEIRPDAGAAPFERPPEADCEPAFEAPGGTFAARVAIAPGTAYLLRRRARVVGRLGDDDVAELRCESLERAIEQIASHGGDVIPLAPRELVQAVERVWQGAQRYGS
ncbi:MAG: WYL domain-containing protein [Bowdeniella nasicola]|nr:WYL domain-containing protein [Bowdeniella nasicola]